MSEQSVFVKSMRPHNVEEPETWREQEVAPTLNSFDLRQGKESTPGVLISSTEAGPARISRWPVNGPVFPASAAVSSTSSCGCCESAR